MRSIEAVVRELGTDPERGLSRDKVEESRQRYGSNQLTPLPRVPAWRKFLAMFDEPIIRILLAAALLSMVVELFKADHSGTLGGIGVAVILIPIALAYAIRQGQWVPALMFVLAIVVFFIGVFSPPHHVPVEGLAVMVAVILATGVAFAAEYKSDREFEILNAQREAIQVKVIRDGEIHTVPMDDVVVGDVVVLEMGDEIPADGRLFKAQELRVDQSLMTGESEPVRKYARPVDETDDGPEHPGCLYRGTQVVDGTGLMCVTAVGDETYLGQIARKLGGEEEQAEAVAEGEAKRIRQKLTISKELTPLQVKLKKLAQLISVVGYIAAAAIFFAQITLGIAHRKVFWPTTWDQSVVVVGELLGYFVNMVIIIVVAVPEGLPMSVTLSLALAMRKMTRANSLVRQLVACETIGSATVICSDKTGTLTQNKMQVDRIAWENTVADRGSEGWVVPEANGGWPRDGKPLDWIVLNSAVNSTANLEMKGDRLFTVGNTTEGALLRYLREGGVDYRELRRRFEPLYQMHFSSERKRMTTVIRYGDRLVSLIKGAPEWILEHATHYLRSDGTVAPWSDEAKRRVQEALDDSAVKAMRTLAFAYKDLPQDMPDDEDALHERRAELEAELVFVGLVAIRDPLREDVADAIQQCREAGIEVKMITGDNVQTARAIGYAIGLIADEQATINGQDGRIMTSDRFNELDDEQLKKVLPGLKILARARPLDKYRMVRLLQELGEVVAVTGDGTNDAPALKKADVGLAMGIAGTEVAKEASKIVLLDDSFSTIVKAVHWGRSLYENIQRFLQFQLTINASALTIFFLGVLIGVEAPFTVLQLLWINVIMDTFAAMALCSEPPRPGVMKVPPKRRDEDILTLPMKRTILATAGFFVVVMLSMLLLMRGTPDRPGMFANAGPDARWAVDVAGTLVGVKASELEKVSVNGIQMWRIKEEATSVDPALWGLRGDVSFTIFQVSLFFSVYVFFQVWNQVNCRSLTPKESGFYRILENPTFIAIATSVAVGQILIVTFGGEIFKVEPLSPVHWLGIAAFTSTVLIFAELSRFVRLRLFPEQVPGASQTGRAAMEGAAS